ncbi:hypothetical protein CHS0354_020637 [Potamilus streckersoni]|uniref:STAS domain-containing protein n=1 Tax=Potamilus streckersoni TaxID=2493646 RepID=A0AAE0T3G4_9BIVA|nr:hypothetical protein CHS0354_020637 [Potamilus streckersoni]
MSRASFELLPSTVDVATINNVDSPKEKLQLPIRRFLHTQADIEKKFSSNAQSTDICTKLMSSVSCSKEKACSTVCDFFPIIKVIRNYQLRNYIVSDILAGISAACLHFPQGLAFGILASLSPAYGLYTSFFPVLLYMIFGTSPHISFGSSSITALLTAELVETEAFKAYPTETAPFTSLSNQSSDLNLTGFGVARDEDDLQYKVSIAAGSAFLAGLILFIIGLCRLGFITTYLSTSFVGGFTTAAAFHIVTSQIPKAIGVQIPIIKGIGKVINIYIAIFSQIQTANVASVLMVVCCAIILIFVKDFINERYKAKLKIPIPIDLILIILATIVSHFGNLNQAYKIKTVKNIPSGFPHPEVPNLSLVSSLIGYSIELAALVFFLTISMAKLMSARHDYEIDDNQELIAYGLSNIVSSFFHCFVSCVAPPRTMLLNALNVKTSLHGIFSASIILLILLFIGPLFSSLPIPVLATMIMVAVKGLLTQVLELPSIWRVSKYDFVTWVVTCSTGILLDLPYGLICGIICSLFVVVLQSQIAKSYLLAKAVDEDIFLNADRYKDLVDIPEINIFGIDHSLYFATSELFQKKLYLDTVNPRHLEKSMEIKVKISNANDIVSSDKQSTVENGDVATKLTKDNEIKVIILDCRAVTFIDLNGVNTLRTIAANYKKVNIELFLANCPAYMYQVLENSDFFSLLPKEQIFFDLPDAVESARMFLTRISTEQKGIDSEE